MQMALAHSEECRSQLLRHTPTDKHRGKQAPNKHASRQRFSFTFAQPLLVSMNSNAALS